MYPFQEVELASNRRRRTFSKDVDSSELIWHRDARDRTVEVLEACGWYLQFDGELPKPLRPGDAYKIPATTWHRVVRRQDCGDLIVEITES